MTQTELVLIKNEYIHIKLFKICIYPHIIANINAYIAYICLCCWVWLGLAGLAWFGLAGAWLGLAALAKYVYF